MINNFKIFENLQQAEKIVYSHPDKLSHYGIYVSMRDFLKKEGSLGYLYLFTKILYEVPTYRLNETFETLVEIFKKIKKFNIKIDVNNIYCDDVRDLEKKVNSIWEKSYINSFIDKWAPGFLKQELKKHTWDMRKALFDINPNIGFYPKNIDTDMLRGKMAAFKTPEEWIEHLGRCALEDKRVEVESSKDNIIYYEDDTWVMYEPLTFEEMNKIVFPKWCTISPNYYYNYKRISTRFIIMYNKKNKKDSLLWQFIKDENDERIIDYNDSYVFSTSYPTNQTYNDLIKYLKTHSPKLNEEQLKILKIFFENIDKFRL